MILVDAERPPLFGGVHNHGACARRPRGLARAADGAVLGARASPVSSDCSRATVAFGASVLHTGGGGCKKNTTRTIVLQ